jgi:hypothetical protein
MALKPVTTIVVLAVAAAGAVAIFSLFGQNNTSTPTAPSGSDTTSITPQGAGGAEILVAGTVEAIGPAADMARQMGTAYVILRDSGRGPPYAVRRIDLTDRGTSFSFSLTDQDIMIPGAPRPTSPLLKVRFDSDGDPMTELPGDLVASTQDFVWGAQDIQLGATVFTGAPE